MTDYTALSAELSAIVEEKRVLTGERIGADFGHDELPGAPAHMPDIAVEALSAEEIAAVMKLCAERGVPVTVRGAGTGKAGGSVPVNGGVVLSVKGMNRILAFDGENKTLTVQPGVLLQDVKAEAAAHGLYYPPDPGEKTATIGGNAATNAAGPCAVKYGATRDYVLAAKVVYPGGETAELCSGDELEALLGSEGTLGVIEELTLKLVDKPACDAILLLPFMDAESCLKAAERLAGEDMGLATIEFLDTELVSFSGAVTGNPVFPVKQDGEDVGATLMLTLEGESDDELDEKMEALAELAEELECLDILVVDTSTLKREVWEAHDAFHTSTETARSADELNISLPGAQLSALVGYAKELAANLGLRALVCAHAGSGGVHVYVVSDKPREEFAPLMSELAQGVYGKCAALGGCIRGEYGIGTAKKEAFRDYCADAYARHCELKAKLDPKGIMNPGKLI